MNRFTTASALLALSAGMASAGGLDRTGQPIGIIFEEGNYAEISIGRANPDVSGSDLRTLNPAGTPSGNVAQSFNQLAGGIKMDINDRLSAAVIYDQPWGSDVSYAVPGASPFAPGSILLGGTQAFADSHAVTGILRYRVTDRFSVHGGLRYQHIDGQINLSGLAYGPLNGYRVGLGGDGGVGWLVGGAYEIPDIALRLAVTYQSEVKHSFDTTENIAPGVISQTAVKTPQSVNIDFQTGIAADTLLLAGIRWADHSVTDLTPAVSGVDLIDIDDSTTYTLGVARRFTPELVGSISFSYEAGGADNLVSPLAPTSGFKSVTLGLQHTRDKVKITGGVRYTDLGDAFAETGTPDVARANFSGNDAVSFGLKIGYYF